MLEIVRRSIASAAGERRQASPGSGRGLARVRDGLSVGPEWQQPAYGEYYARSADVYAVVRRRDAEGAGRPVERAHPVQRLLERPNPWWSGGDLVGATETYLSLWGAAFWRLDRSESGAVTEIWPIRPDRVRVVRDGRGGAHQRGAHLDARARVRAVLRGRRPGHGRAAAARPLQEDGDLAMATTTQRERIATLESAIDAHDREHQLLERLWTQRLIAIEDRLANIEEALQTRLGAPLSNARLSKRDVGLASGSAALATIAWLLLEQLGALAARGG